MYYDPNAFPWTLQYGDIPVKETAEPPEGLVGIQAIKRPGMAQWEYPAPQLIRADRQLEVDGARLRLPNIGWVTTLRIECKCGKPGCQNGMVRDVNGWRSR